MMDLSRSILVSSMLWKLPEDGRRLYMDHLNVIYGGYLKSKFINYSYNIDSGWVRSPKARNEITLTANEDVSKIVCQFLNFICSVVESFTCAQFLRGNSIDMYSIIDYVASASINGDIALNYGRLLKQLVFEDIPQNARSIYVDGKLVEYVETHAIAHLSRKLGILFSDNKVQVEVEALYDAVGRVHRIIGRSTVLPKPKKIEISMTLLECIFWYVNSDQLEVNINAIYDDFTEYRKWSYIQPVGSITDDNIGTFNVQQMLSNDAFITAYKNYERLEALIC